MLSFCLVGQWKKDHAPLRAHVTADFPSEKHMQHAFAIVVSQLHVSSRSVFYFLSVSNGTIYYTSVTNRVTRNDGI